MPLVLVKSSVLETKGIWRPVSCLAVDSEGSPQGKSKTSTQILSACILSTKNTQLQCFLSLMDYSSMHLSNLPLSYLNECSMNVHPMDRQRMWYWFFFFFFKHYYLYSRFLETLVYSTGCTYTWENPVFPHSYILYPTFKPSPILLGGLYLEVFWPLN